MPLRFRSYDLPFLHWLAWNDRPVDYLAQADIERVSGARRLRRAYDLIIFPGHHEYVTSREFGLVMGFRNLGGNLMFLSANNFFGASSGTARSCARSRCGADWAGQAALVGVQYVAYGSHLRGPLRRPSLRRRAVAVPQHGPPEADRASARSGSKSTARPTRRRAESVCWRRSGTGKAVRSRVR